MSQARKRIRKAVVDLLRGRTAARDHVHGTRVDEYKRGELPAISVFTPDEARDLDVAISSTRAITRELSVEIAAVVPLSSSPDVDVMDSLDDMADDIDAVMADDIYLGGAAATSSYESTSLAILKGGDPRIAVLTMTYSVQYRTTPRPPTDPAEFITAGSSLQLDASHIVENVWSPREPAGGRDPATVSGGGVVVTRDATNGMLYPAKAAEWSVVLASAGLAVGPSSVWNLQEASGAALDSIGGITLTPANWSLWRQPVPGAARVAMRSTDAVANCKLMNSTTAPNPALTSTLLLMYVDLPAAPPAVRFVAVAGTGCDIRLNNAGRLVLQTSSATAFPSAAGAGARWLVLQCNNTGKTTRAYTEQEKVVGPYVQPTSAPFLALGGNNGAAGAVGYAYAAQFTGAAAELTDPQIKRLLQALGATVTWS